MLVFKTVSSLQSGVDFAGECSLMFFYLITSLYYNWACCIRWQIHV